MAIFGNNSLRPEEEIGGFESGVNDTGLFSLNEMEDYPGILPNFEYEDQTITSIIFEKEGKDFNYNPQKLELTPQDKVRPIINLNLDDEDKLEPEGESFFRQSKAELDESGLSTYSNKFDKDDFDKYGGEKYDFSNDNLDNRNKVSRENEESVKENYVDEELKNILENSIGRKTTSKNKPTLDDLKYDEVDEIDEQNKINSEDNEAIEELQNEVLDAFFDFSSINADKPSQLGLDGEEVVAQEEEVKEKKKRKKTPLWLLSLYLFAGGLVLTAIFGLVFWKVINKKFNIDGKQDSTKLEKIVLAPVSSSSKNKDKKYKQENPEEKSRHTELTAENDDVRVELKVEIKPEKVHSGTDTHSNIDSHKDASKDAHKDVSKDLSKDSHRESNNDAHKKEDKQHNSEKHKDNKLEIHGSDDKTKIESKITFKDKKESTKPTENKVSHSNSNSNHNSDNHSDGHDDKNSHKDNSKKVSKDNKKEAKNIIEKSEKSKDLADGAKSENKNENKFDNKLDNKLDNKIKSETFIDNYKNETIEEDKPEYSVQIYSTLSKADAQDMLKKLNSYGINNGFIITQNIRNEVWYRVRYGKFYSKDEAKNNASKYGFNQIWIDRVK